MNDDLKQPLDTQKPIDTVEQLRAHLYQAAQVEMSTIPLYLYAAYSIETAGDSQWDPGISAFRAIRSVVIEEMLHLCLVRNLLVATGPPPSPTLFYDRDFVPEFPSRMLHRTPDLKLHLKPCSKELMTEVFMPLELPAPSDAEPQPGEYNTLGQFYGAIADGLERISGPDLWSDPGCDLQYQRAYWNADGGGEVILVKDLPSALAALKTIVEQGEGASPENPTVPILPDAPEVGAVEFSHYEKFKRISEGIDVIGTPRKLPTDPKLKEFEGPVRGLAEFFNAAYCYVLCMIDAIYNATVDDVTREKTSERYRLERTFVAAMGGLLYPLAILLVSQEGPSGYRAAPTFEFYEFSSDLPKHQQLVAMCEALLPSYPSLGGNDGVRQLLGKLPKV